MLFLISGFRNVIDLPCLLVGVQLGWEGDQLRVMDIGSLVSRFWSEGLRTRRTSVFPQRFDLNAPALSIEASSSYFTEPISHSIDSGSTESRGNSKWYLLSAQFKNWFYMYSPAENIR